MYRVNDGHDKTTLRMIVGNNSDDTLPHSLDRFQIGTAGNEVTNTFTPGFTFITNGRLGIKTETPDAELDIRGKFKLVDGSQGSGKVLVSDANGLARWETATLGGGNNPNDCSSTIKYVNGHPYPVIALTNGNSYLSSYLENIPNGARQWTQRFICTHGNLVVQGGELSVITCNNGYISNGTACVPPSSQAPVNCSAMTMALNGRNYQVPAINHNFSATVYSTSPIPNGAANYKQQFVCNNGLVTAHGAEELISHTCNAGYAYNGSACVAGGNADVVDAFSGTTCNTANIQVVTLTPGVDKIPENLNADTLYRLTPGTYSITKKINMNNCSAVV